MIEFDHEETMLTDKQLEFVQALLSGLSINKAAIQAGIGESTAYRWFKLPEFQAVYRDAQRTIFNNAISQLMTDFADARAKLRALMDDPACTPGLQAKCAQYLADHAVRAAEIAARNNQAVERPNIRDLTEEDLQTIIAGTQYLARKNDASE